MLSLRGLCETWSFLRSFRSMLDRVLHALGMVAWRMQIEIILLKILFFIDYHNCLALDFLKDFLKLLVIPRIFHKVLVISC